MLQLLLCLLHHTSSIWCILKSFFATWLTRFEGAKLAAFNVRVAQRNGQLRIRYVIRVNFFWKLTILLKLHFFIGTYKVPVVLVRICKVLDVVNGFLLDKILDCLELKRLIRFEFYHFLLFFVIDKHKHVKATEAANFNSFLEQASLTFTERNIPHIFVFYKK